MGHPFKKEEWHELISKKMENIFSDKDLLNNIVSGLTIVKIVDFNILWLMQFGPKALFTDGTDIISKTSCLSMVILHKVLFHI